MSFWDGKRVCVTGGAGFLGSFLLEQLKQAGATDVFVPTYPEYDLVEQEAIVRMLADSKPDVIIHLAAVVGGIGANMANPGRYFYDNAMMGIQLIEQARLAGVGKFVALGTICAYPKFAPIPFREEDIWDGYPEETNAPYGLAKKMMLVQCQAYRQQYGFDGIFLLPVNLYGPRDNFDLESSHVIPAMIRKMISARDAGTDVTLWGDGSPTREFLYAEDCARAIVMAAEHYDGAEPVNLGAGWEITMKDLAELIGKHVGFEGEIIWDTSKPNGQPRRKLDVTRAKEYFGFEAQMQFDEGIKRTVEWWEANREGYDERHVAHGG
ncbi:MAG: GDP-L-fucose synthase [Actinobacteria bacterium]|nr:GDP-L-fucose synthase [Actinomycetota bacterium]MCG2807751.1 GDP-L-fucose synthase [Coriobacteriia bacterium]